MEFEESSNIHSSVLNHDFVNALWSRFNEGKIRNVYPKAKYEHIIQKIKTMAEDPPVNSPGEYYLLRKFVIATVGTRERLACKDFNSGAKNGFLDLNNVKFYVALEEIYDFIHDAHTSTKHGGRDKIARILQEKGVMNIARDTIELYLAFCQTCRPRLKDSTCLKDGVRKKTMPHRTVQSDKSNDSLISIEEVVSLKKPTVLLTNITLLTDTNLVQVPDIVYPDPKFKHGHIAILDLTSSPDGEYRFILLYMDYQSQFSILRPIKCKCTYEVSSHLLDIFTLFGAPQIIHSDYDSPFLSTVVRELKQSWPECVIVVGTSNINGEKAKQCISEVEKMLRDWINENTSHRWSFGLRFVQLKKNSKISNIGEKSPYEQFFGYTPQNLPPYIDSSLQTEDDLSNAVQRHKIQQPEQLQVALDPNICSFVSVKSETAPFEDELVIDTSVVKQEPLDVEDDSPNN